MNFIDRDGITFPIAIDRNGEIWSRFWSGFSNYFIVVDTGMVIRYIDTKYKKNEILDLIKKYLPNPAKVKSQNN